MEWWSDGVMVKQRADVVLEILVAADVRRL